MPSTATLDRRSRWPRGRTLWTGAREHPPNVPKNLGWTNRLSVDQCQRWPSARQDRPESSPQLRRRPKGDADIRSAVFVPGTTARPPFFTPLGRPCLPELMQSTPSRALTGFGTPCASEIESHCCRLILQADSSYSNVLIRANFAGKSLEMSRSTPWNCRVSVLSNRTTLTLPCLHTWVERPSLMNASVFSNQASANWFATSPPVSKLTTTRPEPNKSAARSR